ncbi:hypothetical protein QJS04_geneDACA011895 [Acorus gramineus]|uniref:Cyanobacterial aminoacyl-tRNA synthetase CAAD domain-containing protein n=1 Tax=Acorus gramineus TaxID=55184 RepID=A0AAV9AJA9_ACOGR|nr:hypothetical protein QJS04_geneDACA011895 [Acorus gramineus]
MATSFGGTSVAAAAVLGSTVLSSSTRSASFASPLSLPRHGSLPSLPMLSASQHSILASTNGIQTDTSWDAVENKSTVLIYGGGAIIAVWLSSIVVGAINSVPLLPKVMELVGLGYTGWFVYRYLLFKIYKLYLAEKM